jgi:hypothetical protein
MLETTPLRHLPDDFPSLTERVWLQTVTGTCAFEAPVAAKQNGRALRHYLREVALTIGGEWRAVTGRGELLAVYCIGTRFEEMTGRRIITLSHQDQVALFAAKRCLKLN